MSGTPNAPVAPTRNGGAGTIDAVDAVVAEYAAQPRSSARTLIATVFGDSVNAHGGTVWLGSLIDLLAPLQISERLVRTSIHRLVLEGFLVARQVGRKSYYSLTESAERDFRHAEDRIYHRPPRHWDGEWTLVIVPEDVVGERRSLLVQRLGWRGFERVNAGTWAHPASPLGPVVELVGDLEMERAVILLRARHGIGAEELARRCAALGQVEESYRQELDRYRPVRAWVEAGGVPTPEQAFLLRTVMIDDYRRIVLRDPLLPDDLLPPDWVGDVTHATVGAVYRAVIAAADAHLERVALTIGGPLPHRSAAYEGRFPVAPE